MYVFMSVTTSFLFLDIVNFLSSVSDVLPCSVIDLYYSSMDILFEFNFMMMMIKARTEWSLLMGDWVRPPECTTPNNGTPVTLPKTR